VHEWRITKYDPARRDGSGAFRGEGWTSWADIGRQFNGRVLTLSDYLETEDRYAAAALAFFRRAGVPRLAVEGLERPDDPPPRAVEYGLADLLHEGRPLHEGQRLAEAAVARTVRLMLRELVWCRLEAPGRFFIHVGYDFYMYVGSRADMPDAVEDAQALGLYVEQFDSPYLPRMSA
jgi:hypothetical protein